MSAAPTSFWQDVDRYHDLAERFERNVAVTHPDILSRRSGTYSCA